MCGGGGDNRVEELESKQALAQQAANALQRYGDVFVPLENMYIQDTLNRFGEDAYNANAGQATQGASAIYEGGLQQLNQGAFNRGLDPTSGSYQTESSALKEAQARGMGLAGAGAGLDNTDQAYQGIGNVVRMGQGLATEAQAGNISLMQSGLDRVGAQAEADFAKSSSIKQVVGTAAGMGAGYGINQGTV